MPLRGTFKSTVLVLVISLFFYSCAAPATKSEGSAGSQHTAAPSFKSGWYLRLPKEDSVVYRGVVSFDGAGTGGSAILYPAPSAAGFLAAIATHAALVGSARQAQKDKLQVAADQVLLPYQKVLEKYKYRELVHRGLEKLTTPGEMRVVEFAPRLEDGWFIETTPTLSMTQDQRALVIDNAVIVYAPGPRTTAAGQYMIRVVSDARRETGVSEFWIANDAANLREESAHLFAQSMDIALGDLAGRFKAGDNPQKTVRYFEGSTEKMERGEIISEQCKRLVIRNLRGWLMSLPSATTAGC